MSISSSRRDHNVDALSQVLNDLRLEGVGYARCSLSAPWGLRFDAQGPARFHFVGAGGAWLRGPDGRWSELATGDIVFLPRGTGHRLADKPSRRSTSIDDVPRKHIGPDVFDVKIAGAGATTLLFCGSIELGEPNLHPLVELMPQVLKVSGAGAADPHLLGLLRIRPTRSKIRGSVVRRCSCASQKRWWHA